MVNSFDLGQKYHQEHRLWTALWFQDVSLPDVSLSRHFPTRTFPYQDVSAAAAAEEISEQGDFTKKVVVSTILFSNYQIVHSFFAQANLNKLGDLDLITLNCNTPGASQLIANAMDDLAGLIEEVGNMNFCNFLSTFSARFFHPAWREICTIEISWVSNVPNV